MERWAIEGADGDARIGVEVEEVPARPRFVARAVSGGIGTADARGEGASAAAAVGELVFLERQGGPRR